MSGHIPEWRRAINGRTWDREWTAYATETHRRPWYAGDFLRAVLCVAGCALIGALLAQAF